MARLVRGEFRVAVLTLVGGTVIAQALGVLASPILTRLFSPADYGEFAAVVAVVAVLASISTLSYQWAIPLPRDDATAANVLAVSFVSILATGAVLAVALALFGGTFLAQIGAASLASFGWLIVLAQVTTAAIGVLRNWAVRTKAFRLIATSSLVQAGSLLAVQIGLGLLSAGSVGLLAGFAIGGGIASLFVGRSLWRDYRGALAHLSVQGIKKAAWRYRRFALLATPGAFLNTLGLRAPLLVLTALYGASVGGLYALAERVVALPVTLLAGSVSQVFVAQAAPLTHSNPAGVQRLFVRTSLSLAGTAVAPAILAIVLAPLLFGFIFGDEWTEAGLMVAILTPWYFVMLITAPTGGALDVLERQDLQLVREIVRLAIFGVTAVAMSVLSLSPIEAVAALSVAGTLVYALFGIVSWWAVRAFVRHPHRLQARDRPAVEEDLVA